ncbi:hypothetical protein AAIH25_11480 [Arthrobacter crystallopoietes]|uniref:hypothetical protein n=1 Tax=Crystallibacter crystallopoietes TaxID=37928 RepID=UPI003D1ACC01
MKRMVLAAVMGLAALVAAACGGPEGVGAFEVEAAPRDALPAYLKAAELDAASSRFLAESDGVAFYAAKPAADGAASAACIVIDGQRDGSSWVVGCSEKAPVATGIEGVRAMLVTDGFDSSRLQQDGWRELHPNLLVKR